MDDRQYRQRGYRGYEQERPGTPAKPSRPSAPAMLPTRTVSRCVDCGTPLPPLTDPLGRCPKCGAAFHACRQCAHFDPGHRFECTQPVPERITDKGARNTCAAFTLHVTVERETSSGSARPDDARRALDNLFKKK